MNCRFSNASSWVTRLTLPSELDLHVQRVDLIAGQLEDPALGLPRAMWLFAGLAGTSVHLHYVIRQCMQMRLERMLREQQP